MSDLLIGLKRFRNATRWKVFFKEKANEENNSKNREEEEISKSKEGFIPSIILSHNEGLNTNLKPSNKSKNAPVASKQVEDFLKEVEITLVKQLNSFYDEK